MSEDQILKVIGAIAAGAPIVEELIMRAIDAYTAKGEFDKAKKLEDILPAKSASRLVQEELEAK